MTILSPITRSTLLLLVCCCWVDVKSATIKSQPNSKTQAFLLNSLIRDEDVHQSQKDESITFTSTSSTTSTSSSSSSSTSTTRQIQDDGNNNIRPYKILSSSEIKNRLTSLASKYSNLATLENAQDKYSLPTAGTTNDCTFDEGPGCRNWILTIEDSVAHPKGSESWKRLPEVFLSGALHGNERIGPSAVLEVATLLLQAASCEGKPSWTKTPTDLSTNPDYKNTLDHAQTCRTNLSARGINSITRKWLARLVTTRRIVIVPMTNALGYDRNQRTEGSIDPNRDFPYDVLDPTKCMQTVCGRTVNEIFRDHMFQISLTFHAGMEIVSYEWGAPTWGRSRSPDDFAQIEIGNAYSHYAGNFAGTPVYETGTMNDNVYPVRGGMEDWAYAGSWDHPRVIQCQPTQFGGYPAEKSVYSDSTLRCFNMLVETSDNKAPTSHLGTSEGLFDFVDTRGNGHIARNIRLAILGIEIVEPYVSIVGANDVLLADDVVPLTNRGGRSCKDSKLVKAPRSKETWITWTVGGGFSIDSTQLFHANWNDVPDEIDGSMTKPLSLDSLAGFQSSNSLQGVTQWHKDGKYLSSFNISIDTSMYNLGDKVAVIASARLDQKWSQMPSNVKPMMGPTSHVVNARTNPDWLHEDVGKIIEGRVDWFSIPLTLMITDDKGGTIDLSDRLVDWNSIDDESIEGGIEEGEDVPLTPVEPRDVPKDVPIDEPKQETSVEPHNEQQDQPENEEPVNGRPTNNNAPMQQTVTRRSRPNIVVIILALLALIILFYRRRRTRHHIPMRRLPRSRRGIIGTMDEEEEFVFDNEFTDDENIQLRQLS